MNMHLLSNSAIPVARDDLERLLHTLISVQQVTGLAASIITERLDQIDGDPDVEANGDEQDGNLSEDDFCLHRPGMWGGGPGCPIADPGGDEHDGREPTDGY